MKYEVKTEGMIGQKFGKLTCLSLHPLRGKSGEAFWCCDCECGRQLAIRGNSLRKGLSKSCGKGACSNRHRHGKTKSAEYYAWTALIQRCTNPQNPKYKIYGGKGISVCERWLRFDNFLADMGARPIGHSIDRINSNGNYEPGNCRWATIVQQNENTSRNKFLTYGGRRQTYSSWAKEIGISVSTLRNRIKNKWPISRVLSREKRVNQWQ